MKNLYQRLAIGYWLLAMALCGCDNQRLYTDNRVMMGTFVEVSSPYKEAKTIVFGEFKRIEGLLSKYNPESEISKLNKTGKLGVSKDTFYIIKKSQEFSRLSEGAFDITVAPLLDLWGFTDKKYSLPAKESIKNVLQLVGSDKIILRDNNNMVKFKLSGMKIDLGAIAKGYALDCAVQELKLRGINSCLINAGGQVYCLGDRFGKPWKVALRNPRTQEILEILEIIDKSLSTAGDYEQYFIKENKRYAHIFNPKTGYPADSGVMSVTVIAGSGQVADFLSTAIFVLGREKGEALAKKFPDAKLIIFEKVR